MNAVILAPGPSLARYTPRPCDMLIGVNRAALRFPVTHWCCGDTPLVEQINGDVIGAPVLVTYGVTMDTLAHRGFRWRGEVVPWTPVADGFLHPSIVNWPMFSFTAAVAYAASRGAARVDVYGCDWDGVEDFDGVEAGKNRSADRWALERGIFGAMVTALAARGCEVVRHEL